MPKFTVTQNHFDQQSLTLLTALSCGELLVNLKEDGIFRHRNKYTIELRQGHIYHPLAKYINHSCEPNSVVNQDTGHIIALKNMSHQQHITINYYESESVITHPFKCSCGYIQCKGFVGTDIVGTDI
jgi:hypothetical protein